MPDIQKLPSGSYRIRKMYHGHEYSVTVPYKPRKGEADQIIAEAIKDAPPPSTDTLMDCCFASWIKPQVFTMKQSASCGS